MFKIITYISLTLFANIILAQNKECSLLKSVNNDISIVNSKDLLCIAKSTKKKNTIIYTFGIWCRFADYI